MFYKFYLIVLTCLFSLSNSMFTVSLKSVTNDNIVNITYGQNSKKLLYTDFSIKAKTNGWLSLGFTDTPDKMIISNAIIGWIDDIPRTKSYHVNSYLSDDIVNSEINTSFFAMNVSIRNVDSFLELNFTKQMGKFNSIIPVIWASHSQLPVSGYWDIHDSYGSSFIDLSKGLMTSNTIEDQISPLYIINALYSFLIIIPSLIIISVLDIKYLVKKIILKIDLNLGELLITSFLVVLMIAFLLCSHFKVIPFYDRDFSQTIGYITLFFYIIVTVPITKTYLIFKLFQVPFERAVKYHRWIGNLICVSILIHLVAVVYKYGFGYLIRYKEVGDQNIIPLYGTTAFILTCILYIFSLNFFRRNYYNLFKNTHWIFISIFISIILHYNNSGYFFIPSIFFYTLSLLKRFRSRFQKVNIKNISRVNNITVLEILDDTALKCVENGSYVFICVPEISLFEWHPFSVSFVDDNSYTLHIKATGDWSKKIYESDKHLSLYVDKFYGHFSIDPLDYKTAIFIAGGIGITPFINAITNILTNTPPNTHIILYWIVKNDKDVNMFKNYLDNFEDNITLKIFTTDGIDKPNITDILTNTLTTISHNDVGIFACGPLRLIDEVQNTAIKKHCDFHKEIFSL